MIDRWRDVFDDAFGRNDRHKARKSEVTTKRGLASPCVHSALATT